MSSLCFSLFFFSYKQTKIPKKSRGSPWLALHWIYFTVGDTSLHVSVMGDLSYRPLLLEAAPFEIGGNFKPDENSVLIVAVPDTKTDINPTLTVTNPDFVDYTANMKIDML
jgi:hypothetical protein